jgi:hypothetical protein
MTIDAFPGIDDDWGILSGGAYVTTLPTSGTS